MRTLSLVIDEFPLIAFGPFPLLPRFVIGNDYFSPNLNFSFFLATKKASYSLFPGLAAVFSLSISVPPEELSPLPLQIEHFFIVD